MLSKLLLSLSLAPTEDGGKGPVELYKVPGDLKLPPH